MLPTILLSQSKVITGNVTDDTGEGLPGVTIQIKNSTNNAEMARIVKERIANLFAITTQMDRI